VSTYLGVYVGGEKSRLPEGGCGCARTPLMILSAFGGRRIAITIDMLYLTSHSIDWTDGGFALFYLWRK
jgi:hypothetical protein